MKKNLFASSTNINNRKTNFVKEDKIKTGIPNNKSKAQFYLLDGDPPMAKVPRTLQKFEKNGNLMEMVHWTI